MVKTKKEKLEAILEGIAYKMIVVGLAGVIYFGGESLTESNRVQKYLVEGNHIAAQQAYERKENYSTAAAGGLVIHCGGLMFSCYNLIRKNRKK